MAFDGIIYLHDQAGRALAAAMDRIAELEEQVKELQAQANSKATRQGPASQLPPLSITPL